MKDKLKKVTDMTINQLLENDIILPSVYFKAFDDNAKAVEVEILDKEFQTEVNKIIVDEFNTISSYMNKTLDGIDSLSQTAEIAKTAIENKDTKELERAVKKLYVLKKEIQSIKKLIFLDETTNTYNRKWIYKELLDNDINFTAAGTMSVVAVQDFSYISETYGQNIADNVLIFISKFLTEKFLLENIKIDIAKYSDDKFLIFTHNEANAVKNVLTNLKVEILNTTLKSKSGVVLKTNFEFAASDYIKNDDFQITLEVLINKLKKNKK